MNIHKLSKLHSYSHTGACTLCPVYVTGDGWKRNRWPIFGSEAGFICIVCASFLTLAVVSQRYRRVLNLKPMLTLLQLSTARTDLVTDSDQLTMLCDE